MTNIEKIRQEIERLKTTNPSEYNYNNAEGYIWAMNDLLAFLDSLPEEKPSEDLEEAAEEYADKHGFRVPYDGSNNYYDDVDVKASKEGFLAGVEWQKNHSFKPTQEHLDTLDTVYKTHGADNACRHILLNLLNQLKEL